MLKARALKLAAAAARAEAAFLRAQAVQTDTHAVAVLAADGSPIAINTLDVGPRDDPSPIVMAHGYGAGLALFGANIAALAARGRRVVAFDWPGMGLSSRPAFPKRRACHSGDGDIREAEQFFLAPFQRWLEAMGLTASGYTLVGHSLGGYLSAVHTLEGSNQEHIHRLVLLSPVGIEPTPARALPKGAPPRAVENLQRAWNLNVTPQALIRLAGRRYGRRLVHRAMARRFHGSDGVVDFEAMADYVYHITAGKGSGEYSMNALLEPVVHANGAGVFARRPLYDRLPGRLQVPTSIAFGDNDWLMQRAAYDMPAEVSIVNGAGHHLYMDQLEEVERIILG